ncbi:MAG: aldehyde dehydrogenase [Flavobacteriales bacterium]|jgi:acyl-CoA reductase-like NAD-dependent aldehyde dehydrogenase|nr:aldehyde dehydrogenase family protein [Flavobacteriales bacterium]MBQ19188.1 aldehyde dehydrogenase [Flavobacteriales bacterium]|tara:strand:- start:58803 stop:59675 length:873 start_codon:yes stop_codon:yes gene_type:complete
MTRIEVLKTYKIFIDGKFPRTESGRYYVPENKCGNICLSSRKDVRNAVVAAGNATSKWQSATAFNKSQVIYRIAEILEGRKAQFIDELTKQGYKAKEAEKEVVTAIDRIIYYAGWCDKFTPVFSSVNPVATQHFNFTAPEAVGTVAILAPEKSGLLGLVSAIIPVIVGGNTVVVLASESLPLCAITFAEVLNTSDVPSGVVNILTGKRSELSEHFATHMDIKALLYYGNDKKEISSIQKNAVNNLKRITIREENDLYNESHQTPYLIEDFLEMKTTWHPIEIIGASGSGY